MLLRIHAYFTLQCTHNSSVFNVSIVCMGGCQLTDPQFLQQLLKLLSFPLKLQVQDPTRVNFVQILKSVLLMHLQTNDILFQSPVFVRAYWVSWFYLSTLTIFCVLMSVCSNVQLTSLVFSRTYNLYGSCIQSFEAI